ncbi:hypothetical protein [Subdoligranulum variabile]|uniref:hypothetical protein n=1 Tax=Subdoligranulum variabile TaxID=214851 RepID=UPI0026F2E464|nr:hypothetical protein [Subdoligranulum variabile]
MAIYICKCGRQVNKSTNADNTGNRDTDSCTGCPYLLPWGPDKYIEGQGFRKEVQGFECRMSPTISYTTTYRGQANDKCTLHILSLDLDFLDTVQAWIDDHAADTLSAGFSRGSMRGTDFSNKGRYSLSISCVQNKKGMAAKAALIEQFFTGGRVRKDMTLAQEKGHILAAIQRGKEQAKRKDQPMKKQNDRCPLQQECERTCKVIGHERDCDYYVNNRYSTGGIPDQDEILDDEEATRLEEIEKGSPSDLSLAPSEPVIYQNDYGTLFAVREHNGAPALMCKPLASDAWTLSGVLAAVQGEAYTAEDLQEVLDEYARAHGWKKAKPESAVPPTPAAPASPAGAGAATQSLSAAGSAALEDEAGAPPAVYYSGLDDQTVADLHLAEREYMRGRKLAEVGLRRMADGVAMAHDALCCTDATNCRNGDGRFTPPEHSFGAWCDSVGLNRKAAERLLQVARLFDNSTPREEKVLEELGPSLLYAAAMPSAPAELVQAVKDRDITSHKQFQDLLAKLKAEQAARKKAETDAAYYRTDSESARAAADDYHRKYEDANTRCNALLDQQTGYITAKQDADSRARAAERERDEARKERDGAREALQASKMRGDRLKAENDDLKARPIEVPAVDEDEIDRRVNARLQQAVYASQEERRQINARNAEDAILLLGRQINTAWQMVRPFLAEMEESRRVEAIDRINREWAQTQKEIMQCL